MKRIAVATLVVVVVLACNALATDVIVNHTYTRTAADSAANAVHTDTSYSSVFLLNKFHSYWFTLIERAQPGGVRDSNFAGDTLLVALQHSANQVNWTALTLQTINLQNAITVDTVINCTVKLTPDSTFTGIFGRFRFIYRDSLEATGKNIVGRSFYKQFQAFINGFN